MGARGMSFAIVRYCPDFIPDRLTAISVCGWDMKGVASYDSDHAGVFNPVNAVEN